MNLPKRYDNGDKHRDKSYKEGHGNYKGTKLQEDKS
jgi:hypothetical protein